MKATDLTPFIATHPGEILKDELDASDISQSEFAKIIGFKRSQLNEFIKSKRNLNADLAILLEKALGIDADFWMEAQKNYDLDSARMKAKNSERLEAIEQLNFIKDKIAYSFLKKEKILKGDPIDDVKLIKTIYDVEHFEQLANMRTEPSFSRFRKSTKLAIDPINIIGWSKLVEYKASMFLVPNFNYTCQNVLIHKLKEIITENEDTIKSSINLLAEYGIKLIIQKKGTKSPVDGISFWSNGNPAIGMSIRHKRVDNFAFTLFHELGHIFKHLVNNNECRFIDLDSKNEEKNYKNSIEEKEANRFAEEFLISDSEWSQYFEKYGLEPLKDANLIDHAKYIGIHPSILRGRVCHKLEFYKVKTQIIYNLQ
ncbi:HigA family addiction module antitoxin [Gillisia hiemivivida]|uniref:HigA family addiction module antidote protein n=1 Tax=Gillisia hiemivivida TaxID=291190 RepID=A0A5C6ZZ61_9FLAO|nr:HigA family addiction module antitoxin [Gillisia hiemivivida]TXD95476.1 HigA family addiction module antidote protein [Gillisia hiemivivida]